MKNNKNKIKVLQKNTNTVDGNNTNQEKSIPRGFFRTIGIIPFIDPNDGLLYKKFKKKVGPAVADEFYRKVVINKDAIAGLHISSSHLGLTKLWYGNNLIETSQVAEELATLAMPANANILDIGGGTGVLAFWMTHIWKDSQVTVADQYAKVGNEWAKEIENTRVTFVNSLLPDLKGVPDQAYNVLILSRVLSYLGWLKFPRHILFESVEDYLNCPDGQELQRLFSEFVMNIKRVMTPDGHIVIVSEWTELFVHLIGRMFEKNGFYIAPEFLVPQRISNHFSIVAFSKSVKWAALHDLTAGMSALMNFPRVPMPFYGSLGEAIRKTFNGGVMLGVMEFAKDERRIKVKQELIAKSGLVLLYSADSQCNRRSLVFPSVKIPEVLKHFHEAINDFEADDSVKIIDKLLVA